MTGWTPDPLLADHQIITWAIPDAQLVVKEPGVNLTASLIRRNEPRHDRAVLYLHGWNDYYFQTHLADWFDAHGFDFYAVELRRYGRNLRRGLYAGYISDLRDYWHELDEAIELIRKDHPQVPITFMGHSTGGLVGSLWAAERPELFNGMILNSPWLDMQGSPTFWKAMAPIAQAMAKINPLRDLGIQPVDFYIRALHVSREGEWDWDLNLKSLHGFVPRFGWGKAILAGHAQVSKGLSIDTPIFVVTSNRSIFSHTWSEEMHEADIVLDVPRITAAAVNLGDAVTICRIKGAVHDVTLSRQPARQQFFRELSRWVDCYIA